MTLVRLVESLIGIRGKTGVGEVNPLRGEVGLQPAHGWLQVGWILMYAGVVGGWERGGPPRRLGDMISARTHLEGDKKYQDFSPNRWCAW